MQSEAIDQIAPALVEAQAEMPAITLDRVVEVRPKTSPPYSYKYATLANVMNTIRPTLKKHGLCIVQIVTLAPSVKTRVLHTSGQWVECDVPMGSVSWAQALGSEISYKRRYGVSAILGLVTEDDDDARGADLGRTPSQTHQDAPQRPETKNTGGDTGDEWGPPRVASWPMECALCGYPIDEGEMCCWNGQRGESARNRHIPGACPQEPPEDDIPFDRGAK